MKIRESILEGSWYPREPAKIREFLCQGGAGGPFADKRPRKGRAAVAPHAGWFYSGGIAARAVSGLGPADTVVIIGGHLPAGAPVLFAGEDAARTPFGPVLFDRELGAAVKKTLGGRDDRYTDNTVEVLVPLVRLFFPDAKILWTRFPADFSSYNAGKVLADTGKRLGRNLAVIGSTDLTHYGDNYDFSPKGRGRAALDWVRDSNDAAFINAVLAGEPREVLCRADEDFSSCSVGAVLGVLGFAHETGLQPARLLEYGTSADADTRGIPDSFVGYAALLWEGI